MTSVVVCSDSSSDKELPLNPSITTTRKVRRTKLLCHENAAQKKLTHIDMQQAASSSVTTRKKL